MTVAERPTRLVLVAVACLGAGDPARGHSADGLGLGDGVRDRLGGRRRGRARPPVDRRGADDPRFPTGEAPCSESGVRRLPHRTPLSLTARARRPAHEVGDDRRRQGDDRQPAAGVRRAPDEVTARAPATGWPDAAAPPAARATRCRRSPRRARRSSRSRSAGVRTSRQRTRPRTSLPRRGEHAPAPGRRSARAGRGASQSTPPSGSCTGRVDEHEPRLAAASAPSPGRRGRARRPSGRARARAAGTARRTRRRSRPGTRRGAPAGGRPRARRRGRAGATKPATDAGARRSRVRARRGPQRRSVQQLLVERSGRRRRRPRRPRARGGRRRAGPPTPGGRPS